MKKIIMIVIGILMISGVWIYMIFSSRPQTTNITTYDISKEINPSDLPDNAKTVNGKYYPLWQPFVDNKSQFIGKTLEDLNNSMQTKITDIQLLPFGDKSAQLIIKGEKFSKSFEVTQGGVVDANSAWVTFLTKDGQQFGIQK